MNKKLRAQLTVSGFLAAVGFAVVAPGSGAVQAAPPANSDNVTICHRTHSVTNPYVRITVDQRSVGNANSKHGGGAHDYYATTLYGSKPNPNVYDPSKTYPANDKKWGDIIPSVDVSGNALTGSALNVAGLNNTGIGASIYNGTGSYAGLCRTMNARDYYEVEVAAGVPSTDVLADMNELDSPDFASTLSACGGTFTGCNPATLGTTSISIATTTTVASGQTATTVAGGSSTTQATLPAGKTLAAGKGAIQVKIWVDANRNGSKGSTEKSMQGVKVTIAGPNGATKTATTDSSGMVDFLDLDPGSWSVVSVLSLNGYEKVYDSDGTTDWSAALTVTAGSVSAASFAAATTTAAAAAATTPGATSVGSLANTGMRNSVPVTVVAMAMLLVGAALVTRRRLTA